MILPSVESLDFDFLAQKPVVVQSRPQAISSDAGLIPIRQFDQRRRYTQRLAGCLVDRRATCDHTHEQRVRQRLYVTLAGQWPFGHLYAVVSQRALLAPSGP